MATVEEEKEFEKMRLEEEKKVEDEEKVAQALTKEEKAKLEASIVLLNAREQEEADKEAFRGVSARTLNHLAAPNIDY